MAWNFLRISIFFLERQQEVPLPEVEPDVTPEVRPELASDARPEVTSDGISEVISELPAIPDDSSLLSWSLEKKNSDSSQIQIVLDSASTVSDKNINVLWLRAGHGKCADRKF